jgi:hypothetical protein
MNNTFKKNLIFSSVKAALPSCHQVQPEVWRRLLELLQVRDALLHLHDDDLLVTFIYF